MDESGLNGWPDTSEQLDHIQRELSGTDPEPWYPPDTQYCVGGCYVCFGRGGQGPGETGDIGWAGAAVLRSDGPCVTATCTGEAGSPYIAGKLALREGALLHGAVLALPGVPDVLLVNATGRDHPLRTGLALHLGAVTGIPTVGVTWRPLLAHGEPPGRIRGRTSSLFIEEEIVAQMLRTRDGIHPVVVHPAWRTDMTTAIEVVLDSVRRSATPEPIRQARRAAREARARDTGR